MSALLPDEDAEAVASAEAQADRLADEILAGPDAPNVALYAALRGLVAFARGSGLFNVSARHLAALDCLPPEADLLAWNAREARMAALRDAA